ncbi:MAG: glycoside hydrolase family 2 TIM barrel-domain containing protein [Verrucomicrobiota bacterium]
MTIQDSINKRTSLNGWWDFQPIKNRAIATVPALGWDNGVYMVPSFWTKSDKAVRRPGEKYFQTAPTPCPDLYEPGAYEYLFDAYGYPDEWSKSRNGWIRRAITLDPLPAGTRRHIHFEAVAPRCRVFLDGTFVASNDDAMLPFDVDITQLTPGDHELALQVLDYEEDAKGRSLTPAGNMLTRFFAGIWQDVWIEQRGEVLVEDVIIRTSTRKQEIELIYNLANTGTAERTVTLNAHIKPWSRDGAATDAVGPDIPSASLSIGPGETVEHRICLPWSDAEWWQPESPTLYVLNTELLADGLCLDRHRERFGFREVWIDGPDLMLNGVPMHLFSDWGHKLTPYHHTEAWIRQWFGMIRDANMNHTRLHTHPHPRLILDLADELGILVTNESAVHGSGGDQASDSPDYWKAAREHVRRFVRRDKNHPSLILWSVENEMRWNGDEASLTKQELPRLRKLFNELDPTRAAYHEGDSSLWNEREQEIVSRHYGKECAGVGWWDKTQPLHSGEMALYHLTGPNSTLHLGGDEVYRSFEAIDRAAAEDCAFVVEAGRVEGVCCFGPWNLSCLENLRMDSELVTLEYEDFTVPGVKPLRVPAHSSEFAFWKDGKGYTPNCSFAIQAHAFRPVAIIDTNLRTGYFAGADCIRTLTVVNDSPANLTGRLSVRLRRDDMVLHEAGWEMTVGQGRQAQQRLQWTIPAELDAGELIYEVSFETRNGTLDTWTRELCIGRPDTIESVEESVAIYGPGSLDRYKFMQHDSFVRIRALSDETLLPYRILVMEENSVDPGSDQAGIVRRFAEKGGRVIVLEQQFSLFASMPTDIKPVQTAFMRAAGHPVLTGLDDTDLRFWGEAFYVEPSSDASVAFNLYRKNDASNALFLADSGEGCFGDGDLEGCALLEAPCGKGLLLACQLRVTPKLDSIPAARRLFSNLLQRALNYKSMDVISPSADADPAALLDHAKTGATVVVRLTDANINAWREASGISLAFDDVGETFQAVRVADDELLLAGLSHDDLSGVRTWTYSRASANNTALEGPFLAHADGLDPLLTTPTRSCLKEMYVKNGKIEPLRTHTQSRFLHAERPREAVVLARLRVGSGQVCFNQFSATGTDAPVRMQRLANRLGLADGTLPHPLPLIAGDTVPEVAAAGTGYPDKLHLMVEGDRNRILTAMAYSSERMPPSGVLKSAEWREVILDGDQWKASDLGEQSEHVLYCRLFSPLARKNLSDMDLNVPNPEAFTFLAVRGEGCVGIRVNDTEYDPIDVVEGEESQFSDISLEQGYNNILVTWRPASPDSTLRMQWRNIMLRPEISFKFI